MLAQALFLSGVLCGGDVQEMLWDTVSGDSAQETRVAVTLSNVDSFGNPANRDAFLDVFEDATAPDSDLGAAGMSRIAGRVGISADAVEEYFGAVNYYRRADGTLVPGLKVQANAGATRNLNRVAGADDVEAAVAEMLEPVAARRMGIQPNQVRAFGEKIDVTGFNLPGGVRTVEGDVYLVDLTFYDMKWTSLPDLTLKKKQIEDLTYILSNPQLGAPIRHVVFPSTVEVSTATEAVIEAANQAIRDARGITDSSVKFITTRNVGAFR